ncbi:unnamed protein product, partial [Polarella glacialis]
PRFASARSLSPREDSALSEEANWRDRCDNARVYANNRSSCLSGVGCHLRGASQDHEATSSDYGRSFRWAQDITPTDPVFMRGFSPRTTLAAATAVKNQSPRRHSRILGFSSSAGSLGNSNGQSSCRSSRAELYEVNSRASTDLSPPNGAEQNAVNGKSRNAILAAKVAARKP